MPVDLNSESRNTGSLGIKRVKRTPPKKTLIMRLKELLRRLFT